METSKGKISPKRIILIVLNVFFYAFILVMLLFSVANIRAKSEDDIPNIFGRGFLSVQSDSMNGDNKDSFKKGDLIFVDMLSDKEIDKLKVGDIISYFDIELRSFNTHRIVEVQDEYFVTQGDLAAKDPGTKYVPGGENNDPNTYEIISKTQVKSKYVSHWNGVGKTYDFILDYFEWTVVLPVALIVILEVVLLVRNIVKLNQEKLKEKYEKEKFEDLSDLEAAKEKLRQEILEELKKEQEEKAQATE